MTDPPGPAGAARPIDRRHFLQAAAAGAALVAAGCGSPSGTGGAASPTRHGTSGGSTARAGPGVSAPPQPPAPAGRPTTADWRRLARSLRGRLVRPASRGYRTDRQLFDFRYDSVQPAGIAYCATPDDVARCIAFSRAHGIVATPRAGGHSYAGYSTSTGLVIDVTPMATVTAPGPGRNTAAIGAGARLIDVYSELNAHGVSIPAGSCPTVGVTGLTLGGGIGAVCRRYGLTSDRVASLQVVTADSRIVTASAETNSDLYWACRGGGGGNFGVVTSWQVETFATETVALFTLTWPWSAAEHVVGSWQAWVGATPDELWSNCLLVAQPGAGEALLQVGGVYLGATAGAAPLIARLVGAAGSPASSDLVAVPFSRAMYVEANCAERSQAACHLPTQTRGGTLTRSPSTAKSELLTSPLVDAGVRASVAAVSTRQDDRLPGAVAFDALGGATARPAPDATAWVHRDARFSLQYSVPLAPGDSPAVLAADQAWLGGLYRSLRPHVSGQSYQNYIDPGLADWPHAYYGANLPRLERIKKRWDPDATFRFAQAIPPAG